MIALHVGDIQALVGPVAIQFGVLLLVEPNELLSGSLEELEEAEQVRDPFIARRKEVCVDLAQLREQIHVQGLFVPGEVVLRRGKEL